ncbi:MAG: hypothetical protein JWO31_3016 [Phycisphaerales bacterium]|nr:hypothetical protein [Phycisphaerales bacterium]
MGRHLLMQSLLGHLALLAEQHPKKASSVVAKRAKVAAVRSLKLVAREPSAVRKAA